MERSTVSAFFLLTLYIVSLNYVTTEVWPWKVISIFVRKKIQASEINISGHMKLSIAHEVKVE